MRILAIGSHPDDIEIGCAGTLRKLAAQGHEIALLVMTRGEVGGDPDVRQQEQRRAARVLRARRVHWGGLADTEIANDRATILVIERIVAREDPDLVFVHAPEDTHQDHRRVSACALSATRHIKSVLYYEVPTTKDFTPNIFVDIGPTFAAKIAALESHRSQVDRTNIPRLSVLRMAEAMANFRGTQSRVRFAEGFQSPRLLLDLPRPRGRRG